MSISRRDVMRATLAATAGAVFARCTQSIRDSIAQSARIIPDDYVLTPGHPRLYLKPADLPELRLRAQTTQISEFDSLLAFYHSRPWTPPATTAPATGPERRRGGDNSETIIRLSLLYLLTADKDHAKAATNEVERLLQIPVNGTYFGAQRRVRALSIAYDYLHDYLDDPYKKRIIKNIEDCIEATYASGEAVDDGQYLAGHVANEVPQFFAAAIAIGDEGNGHAMIKRSLRYLDHFLQNARFFLETDSYQQSYPYSCTYITEIATIFRLLESGFGQNPAPQNPWFRNVVPWWLYALRSDETFLRFGDYYGSIPLFDNASYYQPLAYIATRYRDPHARWFAEQFRLKGRDEFHLLIFPSSCEDTPAAQPPQTLPRTHFHSRMGIAIARGDWDLHPRTAEQIPQRTRPTSTAPATRPNYFSPDPTLFPKGDTGGTIAAFKCSPFYLHNHCHRDANSIVIYHKGDLAIDSGLYDSYETPHWHNYYIRTIAHNTIIVPDPDEHFISRGEEYANDGGQRFINQPHWGPYDISVLKDYKEGTILDQWQKADHSYICGDASNCYNRAKLKKFIRHVIFILDHPHPATVSLLILDEIELNKDGLSPKFLLHSVDEPQTTSNTVTITQGQGRLTTTFLTPATLEKIGGPGKEWLVGNTNYPPRRLGPPHIPGAWRIEATPPPLFLPPSPPPPPPPPPPP
ncbi:MAG: heparinase II/III-family protein, partial [Phycisphaerales bacterium]|nr:heparinase II/III-family protein [Phycisphaerales bacterium]